MDQMACSLAAVDRMLFLDTATLDRALLPIPHGSEILVVDSGLPRALAASGYNTRRAECEAAARSLSVPSLREAAGKNFAALPEPLNRRVRHVVSENARVLAARKADAAAFGALMNRSHASLRDDYEVSVPALDALGGPRSRRGRLWRAHDQRGIRRHMRGPYAGRARPLGWMLDRRRPMEVGNDPI
jgi:galactokinase